MAKVHSTKVMAFERGSRGYCIEHRSDSLACVICGWTPATPCRGQGQGLGIEKTLGWSVDLLERPRKAAPEEVLKSWAREWAKEGLRIDWEKFMPPQGFQVLPRRWIVERTFSWIDHNRRMSKDYEKLCASGEAFVYAAMTRLMPRRLTRL